MITFYGGHWIRMHKVLFPHAFHQSRSFSRFICCCRYHVTLNPTFAEMITACTKRDTKRSWIGLEVEIGYNHLISAWPCPYRLGSKT